MKKKILAVVLAVVILAVAAVGATLAYLTAKSETIVNTFTLGNVSISLTESPFENKKLIPGTTYAKDPKVTVDVDSENCYLFVKIVEDNGALEENIDALDWATAAGWTLVDGETDVYYYNAAITKGTAINILAPGPTVEEVVQNPNGQVTVKSTLTAANMTTLQEAYDAADGDEAKAATLPTLSITAYAVQQDNVADVDAAWAAVEAAYFAEP